MRLNFFQIIIYFLKIFFMSNLEMNNSESLNEYKEVTLFRNPIIIISTSLIMLLEQITKFFKFLLTHKIFLSVLVLVSISSLFDGPHKTVKNTLNNLVLPSIYKLYLFLCLLGWIRNCIIYWFGYWITYFCFISRATHCKSNSCC